MHLWWSSPQLLGVCVTTWTKHLQTIQSGHIVKRRNTLMNVNFNSSLQGKVKDVLSCFTTDWMTRVLPPQLPPIWTLSHLHGLKRDIVCVWTCIYRKQRCVLGFGSYFLTNTCTACWYWWRIELHLHRSLVDQWAHSAICKSHSFRVVGRCVFSFEMTRLGWSGVVEVLEQQMGAKQCTAGGKT